jgi:hypothetical protein
MVRFYKFISVLLLFTTAALPLYSLPHIQIPIEESTSLSYDDFLQLFEQIESGRFEARCSAQEAVAVAQFLAFLARTGALPKRYRCL